MTYPAVNERIKKLIDFYADGSVRKFAKMIGMSAQRVNRLFHFDERRKEKRYPTPSYDILQAIANKFEMLDTNWLFTGQGQMFKVNMDAPVINEPVTDYMTNGHGNAYNEIRENLYKISVPLIPVNAYARYLTDFQENVSEHYETVEFLVNQIGRGRYVAFEIKGDSMDDNSSRSIPDRSLVLARELSKDHWSNKLHLNRYPFWIIVHETSILCKEIVKHDPEKGIIKCHSLNPSPEFQDFELSLNDVKQLFNIVKVQKEIF